MEPTDKVVQSRDVVSRDLGGEVVLLDLAGGTYFGLNVVGVRVWNFVTDQARSLAEIGAMVVAEFDVDEDEAMRDVTALIDDLREHGLLVVDKS